MTPAEVRHAIEHGEHRETLATHWARVFEPPDEAEAPPPVDPDNPWKQAEWERAREVKRARAGQLHPDAAYDIAQVLGVSPHLVIEAKAQAG